MYLHENKIYFNVGCLTWQTGSTGFLYNHIYIRHFGITLSPNLHVTMKLCEIKV